MMNHLQTKLTLFETLPPESAWAKIVDGLDMHPSLEHRLYNYTSVPPSTSWAVIENNLLQGAKVIPFVTRYQRTIRYAAAASIIGIILVASTLLIKRTEAGSLSSNTVEQKTLSNSADAEGPIASYSINSSSLGLIPVKHQQLLAFVQKIFPSKSPANNTAPVFANSQTICEHAAVNPYMAATDGDGASLHLPLALASAFGCADNGPNCRQRILRLREQLSKTGMMADLPMMLDMLRQTPQKP